MVSVRTLSLLASSVIVAVAASVSAEEYITSGDYCNVRNAGTEEAAGIRKSDGRIENTLDDFTFTISCPIMIIFARDEYSVGLTYTNSSSDDQEFQCVLSEFELVGNAKVASYSRTSTLAPDSSGGLEFLNIRLTNPYNRLHMWCSLPPKSSLDQLGMGSF